MAAGRACIGAPGSAQEIIVPGATGLIADPSAPDELADALVALFADPVRREQLGRNGCVRASTVFHRDRFVRELGGALEPYLAC
jgi:glycosyltransferase involved in cell wall biosynthesis